MLLLDRSLGSPAADLALDQALLENVDTANGEEVLRFWELSEVAVIVGRASRVEEEVRRMECENDGVTVVRRCSGGLAVVAGPGCLMYSLVLNVKRRPHLQAIDEAHREVLGRLRETLVLLGHDVVRRGTSDLVQGDRKFSGNSLRCKRNAALYHGTILYDYPLDRIERYLQMPHRQPDYRQNREHGEFVMNLAIDVEALKSGLALAWGATAAEHELPLDRVEELVAQRYSQPQWNQRL